ncbi:MAG: hypothetical protein ACOH2T_18910 [Pseudomonas sp.]
MTARIQCSDRLPELQQDPDEFDFLDCSDPVIGWDADGIPYLVRYVRENGRYDDELIGHNPHWVIEGRDGYTLRLSHITEWASLPD